jgi:hypothetical protein
MLRTLPLASALALAALAAPHALAHEGDVGLAIINNRLVTGIVEEDAGSEWVIANGQRVFLGELDSAGFAADPGLFSGPLGSATGPITIPAGAGLGFNIRTSLLAWNGAGFSATDHQMRLEFASGAVSATTPALPAIVPGFPIGTGTGGFDEHWDFFLQRTAGPLQVGIYLLEVELLLANSSVQASDPIWFVMNFGDTEVAHEVAEEWVEANLVPTPGAAGLIALAGLTATRRRRR